MAVTIADVARKVGKSYQLVSAVLNGGRSSSAASGVTRTRILRVAEKLGYRPNAAAKAVSTGRFNAVGLLLSTDSWKSTLPATMLEGIREAIRAHDLHLSLGWFEDEELTRDSQAPRILRELMADGLLIKYDSSVPPQMVELLGRARVPAIWVNSKRESDCIFPDDLAGGRRATEFLLGLGHRHVAYVDYNPRPPADHYSSSDRRTGYLQAMQAAGRPARVVADRPVQLEQRMNLIRQWLTGAERPTAVVAYSNEDALPVVHTATLLGLRVPEEISVVTFAGQSSGQLGVTLTTMLIPEEEIGRIAVEMLVEKIARPKRLQPPRVVPFGFERGATSGPPPAGFSTSR